MDHTELYKILASSKKVGINTVFSVGWRLQSLTPRSLALTRKKPEYGNNDQLDDMSFGKYYLCLDHTPFFQH